MDCTINRVIADAEFDAVDVRTCAALTGKGLGVLTEIDAIATMKTIKKKSRTDSHPRRGPRTSAEGRRGRLR
ncbi:hypothetical protein ACFQ3C_08665 [Seohaeicola saemankumensis]|uniref:Uncharacterized protein n=1 Tax=Seohaeicola saemankumensis TaxID=481181 RepID=A0ABW3TFF1_9RHOB